MQQYSTFIIDSFDWDPSRGTIELKYSLDDEIEFVETLTMPDKKEWPVHVLHTEAFHRALFALHLAGGVSYYKTCLPKKIEVRSGPLNKEQAQFWNAVYENGLGEFFYKNNIDFRGLIDFPTNSEAPSPSNPELETRKSKRILVPIGGGKDSLVTMELLRKTRADITLFRMGHHRFIDSLATVAGLPLLNVKRGLSQKLFALNEEGALNGHVPITAYLSCVTAVLSQMYRFDAIALSNERSASEGNVEFHGKEINHQWSKSLEFERAFQTYLNKFVTGETQYFSLLRPLSELHITKLLAQYPQYLEHFTSCNTNWKVLGKTQSAGRPASRSAATQEESLSSLSKSDIGRPSLREGWCGTCPKCAFAFALLAAFLPKEQLEKIFGSNFFGAPALQTLYRELLGIEGNKPFECVGTPEETAAAFLLAHKRGDLDDTAAMKEFIEQVLPGIKKPDDLIKNMLTPSVEHAVPREFQSVISAL